MEGCRQALRPKMTMVLDVPPVRSNFARNNGIEQEAPIILTIKVFPYISVSKAIVFRIILPINYQCENL